MQVDIFIIRQSPVCFRFYLRSIFAVIVEMGFIVKQTGVYFNAEERYILSK
jgi:hypothetical protein